MNKVESDNIARQNRDFAIASLVLGIFSLILTLPLLVTVELSGWVGFLFALPAIAGVVCGITVVSRKPGGRGMRSGLGMGITGLAASVIPLALSLFALSEYFESTEIRTVYRKIYSPVYQSDFRTGVSGGSAQPLKDIGKICLKGDYIFANERSRGIHVIDNRDPARPDVAAFITIPANVDIAVRNDTLYADSWTDLVVIDIHDPTRAKEIRRIRNVFPPSPALFPEEPGDAVFERIDAGRGAVVGWKYARTETHTYRAARSRGGCFPPGTDVLTAAGPRAIETVTPGTEVYACSLASGKWSLAKVTGVQAIPFRGEIITITLDSVELQATGNHPFCVLRGDQLASRPLPRDVPQGDGGALGSARWVEARDLRVGDLLATRSGDTAAVAALASRHGEITAYNLEVEGYDTYAVHQRGFLVHNKGRTEGASPSAGKSTGKGGSLARFAIVDKYLYLLSGKNLRMFDIEDPASPIAGKTTEIGWDVETLFPYGDKLLIGGREGMYVYDNSNPARPVRMSRFSHVTSCDPVVVEGTRAYVTLRGGTRCGGRDNRLEIIDIGQIKDPSLVARYPMEGPYGLAVDEGILFICDGKAGLKVFDASEPLRLKSIRTFRDGFPLDVILHEKICILAARDRISQYDYRELSNIRLLSRVPAMD